MKFFTTAALLAALLLNGCAFTLAEPGSSTYVGDAECERRKSERRADYMATTDPKIFPMNFVLPLVVVPIWGLFPVNCDKESNDKADLKNVGGDAVNTGYPERTAQ